MSLGSVVRRALDLHPDAEVRRHEAAHLPRQDLPLGAHRATRDPQHGPGLLTGAAGREERGQTDTEKMPGPAHPVRVAVFGDHCATACRKAVLPQNRLSSQGARVLGLFQS